MATSNQYSSSQLAAMQRDAVRRVQEMQRQAQSRVTGQPPVSKEEPPSPPPAEPVSPTPPSGISEESLLLCILLLLFNEGADGKLLLALLYVLFF